MKPRKRKIESSRFPDTPEVKDFELPVIHTDDGRKVVGTAPEIAQYLLPGQTFSSTWSSPESFARYVEGMDRRKAWDDSAWENGAGFSGSENMKETLTLARDGWNEGAEQVEKMRNIIQASNPKGPRMVKYNIAGSLPSVPRAVAGNIFNMKTIDLARSRRRKTITLLSNMAANCGVSADSITNRAAAVAAIVDQIEEAGYACEVIAIAPTRGGWSGQDKYTACTSVIVKRSDQPVDIKRLAFGLGHASMFRRMVFADWEYEPSARNGLGHGLGHSSDLDNKASEDHMEKGIYRIPSAEGRSNLFVDEKTTMTKGLDYLIGALKKQGCPAFMNYEIKYKEEGKTSLLVLDD